MMFDGGYIGAIVVEEEFVTLCWVMQRAAPAHRRRLGSPGVYFTHNRRFSPSYSPAPSPMNKPVAVAAIPYGYLRREALSPAIFPVGDQIAVIPSFTGDGMSIALLSGMTRRRPCWRAKVLMNSSAA